MLLLKLQFADAPWRQMLTSIPLWAAMMSQTVHNSTFYMMLTQLPTYLNGTSALASAHPSFL